MPPDTAHACAPRRGSQSGYVLLTLILLGALIASVGMTFARHAMLAANDSADSLDHQLAENAMGSGMAFVSQALRSDTDATLSQSLDSGQLTVAVTDTSETKRQITLSKSDGSTSAVAVSAVAEVYPLADGVLPTLSDSAKSDVVRSASVITVSANTTYSDTELAGIIMVRKGVRLTLDNVVLRGAILTENALGPGGWDPSEAAEIVLEGGLLVDSGAMLSGIAIAAPDVIIDGSHPNASLQTHGVVVVRGISMAGPAAFHAQLATELPPVFTGRAEFPGSGRVPRAWPDTLAFGTRGVSRLVFPSADPSNAEKTSIQNFAWPAKGSAGTFAPAVSPR